MWSIFRDVIVFLVVSVYYVLESIVLTLVPRRYRSKSVDGEIVLITGGGGGIGRLLALRFAKLGAIVVVWDINQKELDETVRLVKLAGGNIHGYQCDISHRERIYAAADVVKREIGKVTILVNNAGVVFGKTLMDLPDHMIDTTFQVNILAHYWTTKAFLGDMMEANHGHVVTVSSMTGLMGLYKCTDYSATKFATIGFHESLYSELQTHGHDGVHATIVLPYYINTGMFDGAKPRILPMLMPDDVADEIVAATLANEVSVTIPRSVRWLLPFKSILPAKMCLALMHHVIQGPQSMMTFEGHKKSQLLNGK